jgi:hypothetical protein
MLEHSHPISTQVIFKNPLKALVLHGLIQHRCSKVERKAIRIPLAFKPFSAASAFGHAFSSR